MNSYPLLACCIALLVAAGPIHADNGSVTDSLLNVLNSGVTGEDTATFRLLCEIARSTDSKAIIMEYSERAINLAEKLQISPARPLIMKGWLYLDSGNPMLALECFIRAASYCIKEGNKGSLAAIYQAMAEAYSKLEDYSNEISYLQQAVDIYKERKDSANLANAMCNLGYANCRMGQYDTALVLFSESSRLHLKGNNQQGYAYCLGGKGQVYSRLSEYQKAGDNLVRSIEILEKLGDERAVIDYMVTYAEVLQKQGDIKKAKVYATMSFRKAVRLGLKEYKRDAAYQLSRLHALSSAFDSAYHYQSLYITIGDSIRSKENIQGMANLRTVFEVAKKQAEVDGLQKKKLIQLIVILGLTIILLLAMGLILLYYRNLKRSQNLTAALDERRILLERQSIELKEHQEELLHQKEELQSTLENLKKTQEQLIESERMAAIGGLVAGVAHEINTPVGIGITAISSLQEDIQRMTGMYEKEEISRNDFKEFIKTSGDVSRLIQKNLERTASLIQSFMQVSADQVTEQKRVFVFREYLNDILVSLQPKFREKRIEFNIECDEKLKLNSYPGIYAQIFTNLLLNSLQHGFHKGETGTIGIKAEVKKDLLRIQYTDDGTGIAKNDLPHIFEPFYTSDQSRGTGLGLNIIYNLVRQKLHGAITCESETGKGVLFEIEVPVK
jgi:signal transduction histidine kinase